ncbi:MAG: TolC family protein, partial [Gammaproteobacteria bacterium]|nr:TolC family protein [Gammaproteobacteria bacterium]
MNPLFLRPTRAARSRGVALALAAAVTLTSAGCAIGPAYEAPTASVPAAWKELPAEAGWLPAAPADALDRGEWWSLFADPELDALAARVQISNQNIAAAVASYTQAQALVREQRAALFPTLSASGSTRRSGARGTSPVDQASVSL